MKTEITKSDLVTIRAALITAADEAISNAGWCGDENTEKNLREEAEEYHELYNKLNA